MNLLQSDALTNAHLLLLAALPLMERHPASPTKPTVWEFGIGSDGEERYMLAVSKVAGDLIYDLEGERGWAALLCPMNMDMDSTDLWLTFDVTDDGQMVGLTFHENTWLSYGPDDPDMIEWDRRLREFATEQTGLAIHTPDPDAEGVIDGSHRRPVH